MSDAHRGVHHSWSQVSRKALIASALGLHV
jgi:hypothetical protein